MTGTIHRYGGLAKLRICGNTGPLIFRLAEPGADIADVDLMVDFEYAAKALESITFKIGSS
ncbi:MAG: hypothetical protein ACOX68_02780 [Candidatus Limivicinus sp.]